MSSYTLSKKEIKILHQLDINCRQSNAQIAKKVGVSKEVVQYHIKKFEKKGIIKFYYTIINNLLIGFVNHRVYFSFQNTNPEIEKEIYEYFKNKEKITLHVKIKGLYDMGIMISIESIIECENIINKFLDKYKKYIGLIQHNIFTKVEQFPKNYLEKTDKVWVLGGVENKISLDDKDKEILKILGIDARASIIKIAKKINVDVKTVVNKIKKLERLEIIQAYRAMIDSKQLGRKYFKIDVVLNNYQDRKKISSLVKSFEELVYIDWTLGDKSFEFEVEILELDRIHEMINKIKETADVNKINYYEFNEIYDKLSYLS